MLELRSISKSYASGGSRQVVLNGVSTRLDESGLVCVLGKSGCGKTTLLNIIGGLDHDFDGELVMAGASFRDFTDTAWDRYRASLVGFVFQEAHLVDYLTVFDNVRVSLSFGASPDPAAGTAQADRSLVMDALAKCGIAELADRMPAELSGGQAQRVAIARALVKGPQIVLADEPTGSLDEAAGRQVMDLLADLAQTHLVIVVTHDRDMAEQYATRIIEIADGKIVRDAPRVRVSGRVGDMAATGAGSAVAPLPRTAHASKAAKTATGKLTMWGLARRHCRNRKARTAITAAVTSIGLFGMVMMLALNFGAQAYMGQIAAQSLLRAPIQVKQDGSANALVDAATLLSQSGVYVSEDVDDGVAVDHLALAMFYAAMENRQSCDLNAFVEDIWNDPECAISELAFDVQARYDIELNVYDQRNRLIIRAGEVTLMDDIDIGHAFGEQAEQVVMDNLPAKDSLMRELIFNERTGDSPYEVMAGRMPEAYDEVVIIANGDGHVTDYFEYASGIADLSELSDAATAVLTSTDINVPSQRDSYDFDELLGLTYHVVPTCDYYYRDGKKWEDGRNDWDYMRDVLEDACELKVVGVVKPREGYDDGAELGSIAYTSELMPYLAERALASDIVAEQKANPGIDVFTGKPFDDDFSSASARAQIERDRKILRSILDRADFSQAKRDYVENLTPEQIKVLRSMFADYIETDGTVNFSQSDIETAAALSDNAFIAAIEAYAPPVLNARYEQNLVWLGAADVDMPREVDIYARSFENDAQLKAEIDKYNERLLSRDSDAAQLACANEGQAWMTAVAAAIDAVSRALGALVVIALGVSVVMVFSVTYVSAIERKREVALLRALGASRRDVMSLFNWENAIIGALAGIIGALLAIAAQPLVNFLIGRLTGEGLLVAAPWWAVPLAVAFGVVVAVASGFVPVSRASKADAAAALK